VTFQVTVQPWRRVFIENRKLSKCSGLRDSILDRSCLDRSCLDRSSLGSSNLSRSNQGGSILRVV